MLDSHFARPIASFRLLDVPVTVELPFVITTFLLGGSRLGSAPAFGEWLLVVFVSVLAHELGHALVGRRFGLTPSVRLYGWGGVTSWSAGRSLTPWRSIAVSTAGPIVNIAMGAAAFVATSAVPEEALALRGVLADFVWVAGFWGLVNLAPLLPLDGGHVCEALFARFAAKHEKEGPRLISVVTGVGLGVLAWRGRAVVHAFAALWLAVESARALWTARARARDDELRGELQPKLEAALDARDGDEIVRLVRAAPRPATDWLTTYLAEYLAIGHALRGAFAEAKAALASRRSAERRVSALVEALVVELAVRQRRRGLVEAAGEQNLEAWGLAGSTGGAREPWQTACERLRGKAEAPLDAVGFGRVREAAEILGRDAEAARLGEGLFDAAPDPDLALALSRTWARASDARRAAYWAEQAVELGGSNQASSDDQAAAV